MTRHVLTLALAGACTLGLAQSAFAQGTIKIGELNSYKGLPSDTEVKKLRPAPE